MVALTRILPSKLTSYISKTIFCNTCGSYATSEEPALLLPLELCSSIQSFILKQFIDRKVAYYSVRLPSIILIYSLLYIKEESLPSYFCEICGTYGEAHIERKFVSLPDILFVQLKRFEFVDGLAKKLECRT